MMAISILTLEKEELEHMEVTKMRKGEVMIATAVLIIGLGISALIAVSDIKEIQKQEVTKEQTKHSDNAR